MTEKLYIQNKKGSRHYFRNFPLREEIKQLLLSKNFTKPTPVQAEACQIILEEGLVDLCLIIYCFNGSGKTLSFLIPVLNSVNYKIPCNTFKINPTTQREEPLPQPQALIIVPTETLMQQIYTYLKEYSDYLNTTFGWDLKIGRVYKEVQEWGHIVVGLTEKTSKAMLSTVKYFLTQLKWVVFDQCDDIKENSETYFTPLLKKLSESSSANFIVCSATGNSDPNQEDNDYQPNIKFRKYIQTHIPSKNVVELDIIAMLREDNGDTALTGVSHYYQDATNKDEKIKEILHIFAQKSVKNQMIIFFNSKAELSNFYNDIKQQTHRFTVNSSKATKDNLMVGYIHGSCGCSIKGMHVHTEDCQFTKSQRIRKLRNRDYNVMLATDAIGRGIDIRTVTLVINYSEPHNKTGISDVNYIHRAGRTGRYTDTGVALTFVTGMQLVNMVSKNQKVTFSQMKNFEDLVLESEKCYTINEQAENDELKSSK